MSYYDIIFNPDADSTPFFIDRFIVRCNINTRLNGQYHARSERAPLPLYPIFTDIVHIHPQPMSGFMHVELAVRERLYQFVDLTTQKTELNETGCQYFHCSLMRLIPVIAWLSRLNRCVLRIERQLVQCPLRLTETTVRWERTGNIRSVVIQLAASINKHQLAIINDVIVTRVVEYAAVVARADNRRIGRPATACRHENLHNLSFQLILAHPRTHSLHSTGVGLGTDFGRMTHHRHLSVRFNHTLLMQQMIQRTEFVRRCCTTAHLSPYVIHPLHQLTVKLRARAQIRINTITAFDQARQNVVDIRHRECIVAA